jgi:hypothetical protein
MAGYDTPMSGLLLVQKCPCPPSPIPEFGFSVTVGWTCRCTGALVLIVKVRCSHTSSEEVLMLSWTCKLAGE